MDYLLTILRYGTVLVPLIAVAVVSIGAVVSVCGLLIYRPALGVAAVVLMVGGLVLFAGFCQNAAVSGINSLNTVTNHSSE